MPHIAVIKAHAVLANPSAHPEVLLTMAQVIVDWSTDKRQRMQWLWQNRDPLHVFIRNLKGPSHLKRRRAAAAAVSRVLPAHLVNDFHQARNFLGATTRNMAMAFGMFTSLLELLHCKDLTRVHRYLACVNAERYDAELQPVAFLRWAAQSHISEVLAWRLLHPHAEPAALPA